MNRNEKESCADNSIRYAPPHDRMPRGITQVPGIAQDDPRFLEFGRMKPEDLPKNAKVYVEGCCYHCSYLPDDPTHPPKFCPECGKRFVPFRPDQIANEEEGR